MRAGQLSGLFSRTRRTVAVRQGGNGSILILHTDFLRPCGAAREYLLHWAVSAIGDYINIFLRYAGGVSGHDGKRRPFLIFVKYVKSQQEVPGDRFQGLLCIARANL